MEETKEVSIRNQKTLVLDIVIFMCQRENDYNRTKMLLLMVSSAVDYSIRDGSLQGKEM
ncbi:MAG: hypothetical protein ACQET3_08620 [Promethearchaeati archaeon]